MGWNSRQRWIAILVVAVALAGCGSSSPPGVSIVTDPTQSAPVSRYDMANRCFVMKANGAYAVRNGSGFTANGSDAAAAEHFYMKPSGLGRYIFYTKDKALMTGDGAAVATVTMPVDGSDWTVDGGGGVFSATVLGKALAVDGASHLVQGDAPAQLTFEMAGGCSVYPEMPTGIDSPTFKVNALGTPVIGFAEVHSHMGMGSEMSDGSRHVGPSAGGTMYGQAVNRVGVTEALKDCSGMHGPDGIISPENIVLDQQPTEHHDTVGWPTFIGWPQKDSQLHQQMYYKWVERAYKAGLRTMVIHGTNIEALCNIAKLTGGNKDPNLFDEDCSDMGVGVKQVQYLSDMQNYVDAQEGGPGKGWFRIVKDPAEARGVIADGKLAVIPGLEFSNIFHCSVTFAPDGSETPGCTKDEIDKEIDDVWDLGVRELFPYHDVDSALGGTGVFSSVLDYIGFVGTHGFWKMYACDDGGEGEKYFYNAGAVMETATLTEFRDPITQAIVQFANGVLPVYGPGRQCNARTVTDLGKYAIDKIMKKGFVLDIDHAEIKSKQYMLDQGKRFTPNYPMVSAHGGHGGISNAQAEQLVRQGGILYPAIENGENMVGYIKRVKARWIASGTTRPLAMGYGADSNGLRNLPGPRGAGATPVVYPFTLFQGTGWSSKFSGIAPLKVDELSIPGGKTWDMNVEGMSHYGLAADIVEEIRIEGLKDAEKGDAPRLAPNEALDVFYNSAEAYLQLWEQTAEASVEARKVPSP